MRVSHAKITTFFINFFALPNFLYLWFCHSGIMTGLGSSPLRRKEREGVRERERERGEGRERGASVFVRIREWWFCLCQGERGRGHSSVRSHALTQLTQLNRNVQNKAMLNNCSDVAYKAP